MAESQTQQPGWKKSLRIALIPVLGIVLLAVFFWPDKRDEPIAVNDPTQASENQPQPVQAGNDSVAETTNRKRMPPVALARILEHDPFALPPKIGDEFLSTSEPTEEESARAEREYIEDMVETLKQEKLNVVYRGKKGAWARLGNRIVHEGDELEPGIRILKITSKGLTLEVMDEFEAGSEAID